MKKWQKVALGVAAAIFVFKNPTGAGDLFMHACNSIAKFIDSL